MLVSVARAETLLQKIATVVLADKFGIDTRAVNVFQQQTGQPVFELAPYYEGAHYFNRDPSTVWKLRQSGMGWGQIANKVGMHPGTFNKLRNQGAFDRDQFWTKTCRDRFDTPTDRISTMRRNGGTFEDVLGAIIIGKLSNQDPRAIYDQYKTQQSWTTVASQRNVSFTDWRRVSVPVRNRYTLASSHKSSSASKGMGKSHDDKGKGKGKGSDDKGKGNGKGKGSDKGKGNGGKGKGH